MMFRILALIVFLWFINQIREVFPPFIVGGIIAYLLLPFVTWINITFKIPHKIAIACIYVAFLLLCVGLSNWFGHQIIDQATNLITQRHELVANLLDQLKTSYKWDIDVESRTTAIVEDLEGWFGAPTELMHIGEILSKSLLSLLVCIVSSIYFMVDSDRVGKFFLRFFANEQRGNIVRLFGSMNLMLAKYIRGQLFLIVLMSSVAYIFLHFIFHLKYALVIAIVSGVLEIIPVLGPLMAISTAVVIGVAQHGTQVALPIFLCYWVARLVEDYLVVPRFIGHVVELHPLAIIFAVLVGEVTAGALGMLIAIPTAAAIKEILDFYYPAPSEMKIEGPYPGTPAIENGDTEPKS